MGCSLMVGLNVCIPPEQFVVTGVNLSDCSLDACVLGRAVNPKKILGRRSLLFKKHIRARYMSH
jgi:hypothetical protein